MAQIEAIDLNRLRANLRRPSADVTSFMRPVRSLTATAFIALSMLVGAVFADPAHNQISDRKPPIEERAIFVTGSLIPQRVQLRPIGTTTVSPLRIIDRREIDGTGRQTTPGAFVNEPTVRIIGH